MIAMAKASQPNMNATPPSGVITPVPRGAPKASA